MDVLLAMLYRSAGKAGISYLEWLIWWFFGSHYSVAGNVSASLPLGSLQHALWLNKQLAWRSDWQNGEV